MEGHRNGSEIAYRNGGTFGYKKESGNLQLDLFIYDFFKIDLNISDSCFPVVT